MAFSTVILTWGEGHAFSPCIRGVSRRDVVVLESFSSDRTVEVARAAGARVHRCEFGDPETQWDGARS